MLITFAAADDRFEARGRFEENHLVRGQGWFWDPFKKVWWTKTPERVVGLISFADDDVRDRLKDVAKPAVIHTGKATTLTPVGKKLYAALNQNRRRRRPKAAAQDSGDGDALEELLNNQAATKGEP